MYAHICLKKDNRRKNAAVSSVNCDYQCSTDNLLIANTEDAIVLHKEKSQCSMNVQYCLRKGKGNIPGRMKEV